MTTSLAGYIAVSGDQPGLYAVSFNPDNGALAIGAQAAAIEEPQAFAIHPSGIVYVAWQDHTDDLSAEVHRGHVDAYHIQGPGRLQHLGSAPTHGTTPCHLAVDRDRRWLIVANFRDFGAYGGAGHSSRGSLCLLPLEADGRPQEAAQVVRREGSGAHPTRQTSAHPHHVVIDPSGRFVLVPDLGLDRVLVYQVHEAAGRLEMVETGSLLLPPLSGPRHLCFNPRGDRVYVVHELVSAVRVLSFDPQSGELRLLQTEAAAPADFAGKNGPADVHMHPSGRFVFATNRGHDSVITCAVDPATGAISAKYWFTAPGYKGGDCAMEARGRYLLIPNRETINVLRIEQTGQLSLTGPAVAAPGRTHWLQLYEDV